MSELTAAQIDQTLVRLLRTAFPVPPGQKRLTRRECASLYTHLETCSPEELPSCVGQVLIHLVRSPEWQTKPRGVSKVFMLAEDLDVLQGGTDYEHIRRVYGEASLHVYYEVFFANHGRMASLRKMVDGANTEYTFEYLYRDDGTLLQATMQTDEGWTDERHYGESGRRMIKNQQKKR